MYLKELTNQEFNNFISNSKDKSIYQTPEYGMVMANQKFKPIMLGLFKEDVVVAATLVLINKEDARVYPLGKEAAHLIRICSSNKCRRIRSKARTRIYSK